MKRASDRGDDHVEAARWLAHRLFSEEQVRLGFKNALGHFATSNLRNPDEQTEDDPKDSERDQVIEMRNSAGLWERRGGQCQARLDEALVLVEGRMGTGFEFARYLEQGQGREPMPFWNQENARVRQRVAHRRI